MLKSKKFLFLVFALLICSFVAGCERKRDPFDKYEKMLQQGNATNLVVWNYYNNKQQAAFEEIVTKFNNTIGKEKRIIVTTQSFSSVSELAVGVEKSCKGEPGALQLPNVFQLYSDDLFNINIKYNIAAELDKYFTTDELNLFVDGLIDEGRIGADNKLMLIPFAKSTEIFMMNKTDWDLFSAENDVDINKLSTLEGITEVAESYYEHTGTSFYGRDAIANMMYLNGESLDKPLFTINSYNRATATFDKELFRKMYDHYYVPYVKGHVNSFARYRSDDVKSDLIISYIGSTASTGYFPERLVVGDDDGYDIDSYVAAPQLFNGAEKIAFSQGAGFAVHKQTEKEEYASAIFLKYITAPENNIEIALRLDYLPVLKSALDINKIKEVYPQIFIEKEFAKDNEVTESMKQAALQSKKYATNIKSYEVSVNVMLNYRMYSSKPFINSATVRKIFESSIQNPFYISDRPEVTKSLINAADMIKLINADIDNGMDREAAINTRLEGNFDVWYNELVRIINTEISKST